MTFQVGGRDVTHTFTLLVHKDEATRLELVFPGDDVPISLEIKFESQAAADDNKPAPPATGRIVPTSKTVATLFFTNWGGPFGMVTTTPWRIGTLTNGRPIGIYACIWTIGEMYRADLQIMTWKE
jgi:hypothetical protein